MRTGLRAFALVLLSVMALSSVALAGESKGPAQGSVQFFSPDSPRPIVPEFMSSATCSATCPGGASCSASGPGAYCEDGLGCVAGDEDSGVGVTCGGTFFIYN